MSDGAGRGVVERAHDAAAAGRLAGGLRPLHGGGRGRPRGPADLPVLGEVAYAAGHLDVTIEAWERAHAGAWRPATRSRRPGQPSRRHAPAVRHRPHGTGARLARASGAAARGSGRDAGARVVCGGPHLRADADRRPRRRSAVGAACDRGRFDVRPGGVRDRTRGRGPAPHPRRRRRSKVWRCSTRSGWRRSPGDLDPLSTGVVYCELVCALQGLAQYDLAEEWTEAMERWCKTNAIGSLHGRCRVHRAEILRLRGSCDEAETEALVACEELRPYLRRELGWPLSELGRIRLRKGDIEGAEEACSPLIAPGGIRNPVSRWCAWPRRRGHGGRLHPRRARAAPCGCPRRSCRPTPSCGGRRCSRRRSRSRSRPATSTGPAQPPTSSSSSPPDSRARRWSPARPSLEEGCGSPRAMPRTRNVSSPRLRDSGTRSARRMRRRSHAWASPRRSAPAAASTRPRWSAEAARTIFDGIEAAPIGDAAAHVERQDGVDEQPAASVNIFRREGDYWSVVFEGRTVRVRDLKGMRYLARLLADPGREFHVLDLVAAETGSLRRRRAASAAGAAAHDARRCGRDARRTSQERVPPTPRRDRRGHRGSARHRGHRAGRAGGHRTRLPRSRAIARGRPRRSRSTSRDPRPSGPESAVTRAIRQAMARIGEHHPELGKHLDRAIRTGTYCAYLPGPPGAPVQMEVLSSVHNQRPAPVGKVIGT